MATASELTAALSGYYSFEELKDLGRLTLTIKSAAVESVGQGDKAEDKPVLAFVESRRKLVLNKTRLTQLAEIVGPTENPVGKRVTLHATPFKVNGRTFDMVILEAPEEPKS